MHSVAATWTILLSFGLLLAPRMSSADTQMEPLLSRRIFFGHQSVGGNILEGLRDVASVRKVPLKIVAWSGPSSLEESAVAETAIGRNEAPSSKLQHFRELVDGGVGGRADIAFFKFCYIDFRPETDVEVLFNEYKTTLDSLIARHPQTRFVHVTVPLTVVQTGPKAWLKRMFGKTPYGVLENEVRHRFNEKLRKTYGASVFDLARAESSGEAGALARYERNGTFIPYLLPTYTDDGEHLNAEGRRRVALELWGFLENVSLPR
jgi:hypothetical protein